MDTITSSDRTRLRVRFGYEGEDAARKAGVSVDDWNRWETHQPVPPHTHLQCMHVFALPLLLRRQSFIDSWRAHPIGPRAGAALATTYARWIFETARWMADPDPLTVRRIGPMAQFNPVVFTRVVDVETFVRRMLRVLVVGFDEISRGQLPTQMRDLSLMDEVVLDAAVHETHQIPGYLRGAWFNELYRLPDVGWKWDRVARQISGTYRFNDHRAFVDPAHRHVQDVLAGVPYRAWFKPPRDHNHPFSPVSAA